MNISGSDLVAGLDGLSSGLLVEVLEEAASILASRAGEAARGDPVSLAEGRAAMDLGRRLVRATDFIESALAFEVRKVHVSGAIRESAYSSVKTWMTTQFKCFGNASPKRAVLADELARLDATRKSLATGSITADQASAITKTTSHLKDDEDAQRAEGMLLGLAEAGAGPDEVSRSGHMASFLINPKSAIERANQVHDRRQLSVWWDKRTCALRGSFTLPPESGARLTAALDACNKTRPHGDDRNLRQCNADALDALLAGAVHTEMLVWTTADTLADPAGTIPAQLRPSGMPLPAADARRLAGTGNTVLRALTVTRSGLPQEVGRRVRGWTGGQRRFIETRDQQCIVQGCTVPAELCQIDHLDKHAFGGETRVANGGAICGWHNRDRDIHPGRYQLYHDAEGRPRYRITTRNDQPRTALINSGSDQPARSLINSGDDQPARPLIIPGNDQSRPALINFASKHDNGGLIISLDDQAA